MDDSENDCLDENIYFEKYKKLKDADNSGKEFEVLMCMWFSLTMSFSDLILDFKMSSNNAAYGKFDDICIEVTFANGTVRKFLFQLKHKSDGSKKITETHLTSPDSKKGPFYLEKFFQSMTNLKDKICIVFTNIACGFKLNVKYLDKYTATGCKALEYFNLFSTSQRTTLENIIVFRNCEHDEVYFFTRQLNVEEIKSKLHSELSARFKYNIYPQFYEYVTYWWSKKFILNKQDAICKCAELALAPYLYQLSNTNINDQTNYLQQAIMTYQITFISSKDDTICKIWPEMNDNSRTVQHVKHKFNLYDSDDKNKVFWHLQKQPLLVKLNLLNKEIIFCVVNILKMYRKEYKLVIIGEEDKTRFEGLSDFVRLTNLCNTLRHFDESLYVNIVSNYKISIKGRPAISLKQLLNVDENFSFAIGVHELVKMSQGILIIGDKSHDLNRDLIDRTITRVRLNLAQFLNFIEMTSSLVIIKCNEGFKSCLSKLHFMEVSNLNNYLRKQDDSKLLVVTDQNCPFDSFSLICKENRNVFVFDAFNEDNIVLSRIKGDLNTFTDLQFKEDLIQCDFFTKLTNKLNIICATPGMGKSTLLRMLNANCPSDLWTIYVELINFDRVFSKSNLSYEEIFEMILQQDVVKEGSILSLFRKIYIDGQRICLFLYGVDKMSSHNFGRVLQFTEYCINKNITVWLSSRENLREHIIEHLNILPLEIKEFTRKQQKQYIFKRLKDKYTEMEIFEISEIIFNKADLIENQDLLGIPLQLYIITETFLKSFTKETFLHLNEMYELFFEGKRSFAFKKLQIDESRQNKLRGGFKNILQQYEIPALQACLDEDDFNKLNLPTKAELQNRIDHIKTDGDVFGIIKKIRDNDRFVFTHPSYPEWLSCVWFLKNPKALARLGSNFFIEKYENLRRMFDLILAENHPLHSAILHKNLEQFRRHLDKVDEKDECGRTPLHLACCYGKKYPKSKPWYTIPEETKFYKEIVSVLIQQTRDISETDKLFNFNCIDYALHSNCLYPVEIILQENKMISLIDLKIYPIETMIFYALHLSFKSLLKCVLQETSDFLLNLIQNYNKEESPEVLERMFSTVEKWLHYNIVPNPKVLDLACEKGYNKMIELLLQYGYKCSDGNPVLYKMIINNTFDQTLSKIDFNASNEYGETVLHLICKTHNRDFVITEKLVKCFNVNSRDVKGRTAFHNACKHRTLNELKILTNAKANIFDLDFNGNTVLHITTERDINQENDNKIDFFLDLGLDINQKNLLGQTALHTACENSNFEDALHLIKCGAKLEVKDFKGNNALHIACLSKTVNIRIIDYLLLQAGFDVNERNYSGQTALFNACSQGNFENVVHLTEHGADFTVLDNAGRNVLYMACSSSNVEIIDYFLNKGIDIHAVDPFGVTIFLHALTLCNFNIVEHLLKKGKNLIARDFIDNNALHFASEAYSPNKEMISILLKYGFDVNSKNRNHKTALHKACKSGCLENFLHLIENGGNVYLKDVYGDNALHMAAGSNSPKIMEHLLKMGFEVDAKGHFGQTPFHCACAFGSVANASYLVDYGADVHIRNACNDNALHIACQVYGNNVAMFDFLLNQGFDINEKGLRGYTALHHACQHENLDNVLFLVQKGGDLNLSDSLGNNTLHVACSSLAYNVSVIDYLVSQGFDLNEKSKSGKTALDGVCESGNLKKVEYLIKKGAQEYSKEKNRNTPLHIICESNPPNIEIIDLLLKRGFNVNEKGSLGTTPLLNACEHGNFENAMYLIKKGADLKAKNNFGSNALFCACLSLEPNSKLIEFLLNRGFSLYEVDKNGNTVLHNACLGHFENLVFLVQKGALLFSKNANNDNALHLACSKMFCSGEIIRYLLKKGFNVNERGSCGRTALHIACRARCLENVERLVQNRADLNLKDANNNNALHIASATNDSNTQVIDYLLSKKLNINEKGAMGQTSLHQACYMGNSKNAFHLIKKGADLNIKDMKGDDVLQIACSSQVSNTKIIKFLLEKGFDVNRRDGTGCTPIHRACQGGNLDNVMFLLENGANLLMKTGNGSNLLHSIVSVNLMKNPKIIDFLLCKGFYINEKNVERRTAFLEAILNDHFENAFYLLKRGALVPPTFRNVRSLRDLMVESQRYKMYFTA